MQKKIDDKISVEFDRPAEERGSVISFKLSGRGSGLLLLDKNYREIHRVQVRYYMALDGSNVVGLVTLMTNKFAYWEADQSDDPTEQRFAGLARIEEGALVSLAGKIAKALEGCVGAM